MIGVAKATGLRRDVRAFSSARGYAQDEVRGVGHRVALDHALVVGAGPGVALVVREIQGR